MAQNFVTPTAVGEGGPRRGRGRGAKEWGKIETKREGKQERERERGTEGKRERERESRLVFLADLWWPKDFLLTAYAKWFLLR